MNSQSNEITQISIENEIKTSYLDYAMSVIVGRALPDVRDGLKPVHRRVLFGMKVGGYDYNKPHKKSARIVGDVIGKYHPHGDTAVYDTIVRMAQDFSLRYTLVDGQGNFGSVDGDSPAAMRYTEVRMTKIAHTLLADLDKNTVNFSPNYDGSELIPDVLPTKIPNLLVNGSSGIAVGMATNIPPHNLTEVINACIALLENKDLTLDELLQIIPGPDFPTGGIINGTKGIRDAYATGQGKIHIRAKTEIKQDSKGKETILVHEIPYQVNKAKLVENIHNLVKNKKIVGIAAIRDESDKDGLTIVIEVKRDASAELILNQLFSLTQLQLSFGFNMVALDHGEPKLLTLRDILTAFIDHRKEVISRRTLFEIKKLEDRIHILEGLGIALLNIDAVIEKIRRTNSLAEAREILENYTWQVDTNFNEFTTFLPQQYKLSKLQVQAILDIRLQKLTNLEFSNIIQEYKESNTSKEHLQKILDSRSVLEETIIQELNEIKEQFSDKRLTAIQHELIDLSIEDLTPKEDVIVTLSHEGYIKYQLLSDYEAQHRGGKGKSAAVVKEDDFIENIYSVNTHDTMLCFSNIGKIYWIKVYQLPMATKNSRGKPIINIIPLQENERITTILTIKEYNDNYIVMATKLGYIKKTSLMEFSRPRSSGIIAINLNEGDELINASLTDGQDDIMLFSSHGKTIRFNETTVRAMGRQAIGVIGMRLSPYDINGVADAVVSLVVPHRNTDDSIIVVSQNGFGKRTPVDQFPIKKTRAGSGVISMIVDKRNGTTIGAHQVHIDDEIMLITNSGKLIRVPVNEVSLVSRNTKGVTIMKQNEGEFLVGSAKIYETLNLTEQSDS